MALIMEHQFQCNVMEAYAQVRRSIGLVDKKDFVAAKLINIPRRAMKKDTILLAVALQVTTLNIDEKKPKESRKRKHTFGCV